MDSVNNATAVVGKVGTVKDGNAFSWSKTGSHGSGVESERGGIGGCGIGDGDVSAESIKATWTHSEDGGSSATARNETKTGGVGRNATEWVGAIANENAIRCEGYCAGTATRDSEWAASEREAVELWVGEDG